MNASLCLQYRGKHSLFFSSNSETLSSFFATGSHEEITTLTLFFSNQQFANNDTKNSEHSSILSEKYLLQNFKINKIQSNYFHAI